MNFRPIYLAFLMLCAPALPQSVEIRKDLVYSTPGSRDLHLDLFLPKFDHGPLPAVLYLHGGGWKAGSKDGFHRQAERLAAHGFVGACIEYRLSTEAKFPAALFDAKAAVRWLRANAAKYHVDANRIAAVGSSAGGHLAAMLGTTADEKQFEGPAGAIWDSAGFSSRVHAVVAFNPATDFTAFGRQKPDAAGDDIRYLFLGATFTQNPQLWANASPVNHVTKDSAPFLFLHGTADPTYSQSTEMIERLRVAGVPAELFTAKDAPHGFFNSAPWFEPTLERMEEFLRRMLK